jgi:phage internal scaffolding protein
MKKSIFLRTAYNYDTNAASNASGLVCEEPTRAQQHHKDECDINVILERFGKTGQVPVSAISAQYGDFTGVNDYHTALNTLIAAEREFEALPAKLRTMFDNEPANLIEFLNDENNKDKAIELGLVNPPITSSFNEPVEVKQPVTDPS